LFNAAPKLLSRQAVAHKVRFRTIGDMRGLPIETRKILRDFEKQTKENTGMTVVGGLNYGGRDELVRAMKKIAKAKLSPSDISEQAVSQSLDTAGIPDPDLVIRTGGRSRLSGFMPWQTVYSELYFSDTLWPDFNEKELDKAIALFHNIQRNFGK
jgi:undecaprenyl diphosphate synthase